MTLLLLFLLQTAYARPDALVDTAWLAAHGADPEVRIVDARPRGYEEGHIPGAVHLGPGASRDPNAPPTFLPSRESFERIMGELGISNRTRVIVYDERGLFGTRVWWILHYFGHANVAVLDGGWVAWTREGRPVSTAPPRITPVTFTAAPDPRWLATADDVRAAIDRPNRTIVDARTREEIEGRDLRGIRRGGFIPSAVPFYWEDVLDPEWRTFRPADELSRLVHELGLTRDDEIVAYCQVGLRASHDLFVLYLLGFDRLRNYLGSWEEWGTRDDLPLATVR